jgi:hypothetical protein
MQCNIDQRGSRVRLWWGIASLVLAIFLAGAALWWQNLIVGAIAVAAAMSGGFAIFEARTRWCVLRALGIKTRI